MSTAPVADAADSSSPPPDVWGYSPSAAGFDEAFATDGSARPPYDELFRGAVAARRRRVRLAAGPKRSARSATTASPTTCTAIRAAKIAPGSSIRCHCWSAPTEWAALERGLEQRARLLDAVLADIYGPCRLISDGVIPAELVLGNRGFLRPLCGVPVIGGGRLHIYAADLARGLRRALLGARRSHASAVRRRLRAREPHRRLAHAPAGLSRLPDRAAGVVFSHAARRAGPAFAAQYR